MGKLGNDTIVSSVKQDAGGHPCFILSASNTRKMGMKEFLLRSQSQKLPLQRELTLPLWIRAVTPKRCHFGLIYKLVLPLKSRHCYQQNNNAQRPTTTEDQWLNYKPRWTMVLTISLLLPISSLASISYLFNRPSLLPHLPEWLGFVINWSGQHLNYCFLISCRVYTQRTSSPSNRLEKETSKWTSRQKK